MPTVHKQTTLVHRVENLFALVIDIDKYPQFLPWCRSATVHSRNNDEIKATIEIAKGAFHQSFTTLNRLQKNKMIEMRLLSGPFHHFEAFWQFESLNETQSKISFDLEYKFSSRFLGLIAEPIFNPIANTLVDAFCQRANKVYGNEMGLKG